MKKAISLFLTLILVFSMASSSFAAGADFDYLGVLGGRDGYEYDVANKVWMFYRPYVKTFSDAYIVVGLQVESNPGESAMGVLYLYARVLQWSGDPLYTVTSIEFDIGKDKYCYEEMLEGDTSMVPIGEDGMALIRALANCDTSDVTLKVGVDDGVFTLDPDSNQLKASLKEFCRIFLKYKLWDYCGNKDEINEAEDYFPLKVNGKYVDPDLNK